LNVRRAATGDAAAIGAVHVTAWRSAYPGILPADYLAGLSYARQALHYDRAIRAGAGVFVATFGTPARVVGFCSADRSRRPALAEGEIETLYMLDDFREQGAGRRLMARAAAHMAGLGLGSAFVQVLSENPARWFYQRLGGRLALEETIRFASVDLRQSVYCWDRLDALLHSGPAPDGQEPPQE
jgi:ribosomal protein S18 acetylase RimI-like enzyme